MIGKYIYINLLFRDDFSHSQINLIQYKSRASFKGVFSYALYSMDFVTSYHNDKKVIILLSAIGFLIYKKDEM